MKSLTLLARYDNQAQSKERRLSIMIFTMATAARAILAANIRHKSVHCQLW